MTRVISQAKILQPLPWKGSIGGGDVTHLPPPQDLDKGIMITCANKRCGAEIAVTNRQLFRGERLPTVYLDFARGQQRKDHDPCECKRCGTGYIKNLNGTRRYHTEVGWV